MSIIDTLPRIENFISKLHKELQEELPGASAQEIMAPSIRQYSLEKSDPSKALNSGVLLLLYPKAEKLHLCFIKRTSGNHNHSGQISLPGGKYEKTDTSLIETALRETQEELGISTNNLKILGQLTQLYIPVSNFFVLPVVAYSKKQPIFHPSPFEVEKVIETPIKELFRPENRSEFEIPKNGLTIHAPYFNAEGNKIWGATAMIISEFHEILKKIPEFNW
ncbi:MAG: CoA pyrophosphatase [Marinifilaceae bacterium]|jgi:8-oxo-dGTP pyrophosphatase MutT (NUDIX family)